MTEKPDVNHAVRQAEEGGLPFDADTDPAPEGDGELHNVSPEPGGFKGRDPKTEMPIIPSAPETHDDGGEFDPPDSKERSIHE
jgi:hypothetical protein